MRRLLIILAVAVVLLALTAFGGSLRPDAAHGDNPPAGLLTVNGHGDVAAVPDQAGVSAGVRTAGSSAAQTLAANATATTAVVAALRQAGGTDLQTAQVSLEPQTDPKGRVTGYVAQDTVSAEATIARAGALIDAAVAAGANTVEGPALSVSDSAGLYDDALKAAVADARAKAAVLAQAGGFAVGPVSSVTEEDGGGDTPEPLAAASGKAETPIEPGSQDVSADVTVSFTLR